MDTVVSRSVDPAVLSTYKHTDRHETCPDTFLFQPLEVEPLERKKLLSVF